MSSQGKVYLVGAGPGSPDLLTVKAARLLETAGAVLHDALVSPAILDLVSPHAKLVNIGKRCGQKLLTQDEINSVLVHYAGMFSTVVRLKGGDPLLFGRAGEEMDALRAAGIEFEVVPGVTSGLASAAAAGVSLTDRRIASQVLFTTAHREAGRIALDWAGLIGSDTTVVIYMPGREYAHLSASLVEAGLDARTPCVVASCASLPTQQLKRTTVGTLGDEIGLPAPSLLIVGWVVAPSLSLNVVGPPLSLPVLERQDGVFPEQNPVAPPLSLNAVGPSLSLNVVAPPLSRAVFARQGGVVPDENVF